MTDGKKMAPVGQARLIVWCVDARAGKPVLDALRRGYDLDMRTTLPKESLTDASDAGPDILLLCRSPVETLCRAMASGVIPGVALKEWRDLAQDILALNRRNRRKVRILDMDMAARHPGAFLRWFALAEDQDMIAALSGNRQPDRDEVLHLLARRILLGDTHARALTGELKAVSLNFAKGDDTGADNPDAAFLAYRACLQTRAQVSLLQAQNRYMQDETEAHLTRAEAGQAEKQQRIDALTADLSGRENAVAALELELQRFLASRSYRLTAPLRRIRALLSRGGRV